MTRKDYVLIAAALKQAHRECVNTCASGPLHIGAERAAYVLADALARDNARFDRERFLKAAGVQS